jgi:thiamine transport system substrate-binding protein
MECKMLKYIILIWASFGMMMQPVTAQEKPELIIYTYDSFASEWGPGPAIKAEFEKTCNCEVTFIGLDSSVGILGRIQLEGEASKADIALGLDTSLTSLASNTGLFTDHQLDLRGKLALPDDVGFWDDQIFAPVDWGYFAFVYNKDTLPTPPGSFEELIDTWNDLRIVIQDPRTATPGLGLMLWVNAVYGENAPDIWAKLAPKIVTVTKGWWDSYSMFLEGEADMVLSYSTSPAYHLIAEGKDNYAAAAFTEGHYTQVEVAAVLKSSTKPALARLFLQKLLEPEMQSLLPTTNWMYPVAKDANIPEGFGTLITPSRAFLFSPEEVERNRKGWTDAFINGLSQ